MSQLDFLQEWHRHARRGEAITQSTLQCFHIPCSRVPCPGCDRDYDDYLRVVDGTPAQDIPVTNIIENMMSTVRRVCRNVKRWGGHARSQEGLFAG